MTSINQPLIVIRQSSANNEPSGEEEKKKKCALVSIIQLRKRDTLLAISKKMNLLKKGVLTCIKICSTELSSVITSLNLCNPIRKISKKDFYDDGTYFFIYHI